MNPQTYTKRLSRDTTYKLPEQTYQSTLTTEEIAKKLDGYTRIESNKINSIPLNTHLRYFTVNPKNNQKQFRLGGYITKFGENGEYIILSNGEKSWSVQLGNTIFYKKQNLNEYKEQVVSEIDESIKKQMETLQKENKELKKVLKEIKETTLKNKREKIKEKK